MSLPPLKKIGNLLLNITLKNQTGPPEILATMGLYKIHILKSERMSEWPYLWYFYILKSLTLPWLSMTAVAA